MWLFILISLTKDDMKLWLIFVLMTKIRMRDKRTELFTMKALEMPRITTTCCDLLVKDLSQFFPSFALYVLWHHGHIFQISLQSLRKSSASFFAFQSFNSLIILDTQLREPKSSHPETMLPSVMWILLTLKPCCPGLWKLFTIINLGIFRRF